MLSRVDLFQAIRLRFDADDAAVRANACFAASWARDGAQLSDLLTQSLDDLNEQVIAAAMAGLDRIRIRSIGADLEVRAKGSDGLTVKWMYIDAMIGIIDPGDVFRAWPEELQAACEGLSPIVLEYVHDRLKRRRSKLFDRLKGESITK